MKAQISIHAPHTGRDCRGAGAVRRTSHFNPRAPYGARQKGIFIRPVTPVFQSTRPIRGATRRAYRSFCGTPHFNPRAPYGARQKGIFIRPVTPVFQSTRPIRGATLIGNGRDHRMQKFQSTRPIRGATMTAAEIDALEQISIHAPHTGRD